MGDDQHPIEINYYSEFADNHDSGFALRMSQGRIMLLGFYVLFRGNTIDSFLDVYPKPRLFLPKKMDKELLYSGQYMR